MRGRIAGMNTHRDNALVAILDRVYKQIVESDTLLLKSLTVGDRRRVTDELAYLQTKRLDAAAGIGTNSISHQRATFGDDGRGRL
jgi:hypothetical protein